MGRGLGHGLNSIVPGKSNTIDTLFIVKRFGIGDPHASCHRSVLGKVSGHPVNGKA